ncbi:hypothetical protein JF531_01025 [Microbacterium esteraromaticum]|uniref:hypothetical protein n=1 Tax=Microbacterium esteraromaticum TaxID=57043 RepID=UPI001A8E178A|nr:hypothetical protein [Microbacterium esteraromaticum]MBN8423101.1 hypothetical protein [Microbacterium esteraromaticum]
MSALDANEHASGEPRPEDVQAFVDALVRLTDDPTWLLTSLTETLASMHTPGVPTAAEVDFLLGSGAFSRSELATIRGRVARGSLALEGAQAFLSAVRATWSMDQVSGYLRWTTDAVRDAVDEGQLYAVEVAQHLRFPVFQFNVGHPQALIPHLPELIVATRGSWGWISFVAFMGTRQNALMTASRQTPRDWLIDGGGIGDVLDILRAQDWR